jgi:hypothetical protein
MESQMSQCGGGCSFVDVALTSALHIKLGVTLDVGANAAGRCDPPASARAIGAQVLEIIWMTEAPPKLKPGPLTDVARL